jgi:hypothetical protein
MKRAVRRIGGGLGSLISVLLLGVMITPSASAVYLKSEGKRLPTGTPITESVRLKDQKTGEFVCEIQVQGSVGNNGNPRTTLRLGSSSPPCAFAEGGLLFVKAHAMETTQKATITERGECAYATLHKRNSAAFTPGKPLTFSLLIYGRSVGGGPTCSGKTRFLWEAAFLDSQTKMVLETEP